MPSPVHGQAPPRSILLLDIDTPVHPWSQRTINAFHAAIKSAAPAGVTTYVEYLGWHTFTGERYLQQLKQHLLEKYRDKPISVIVCTCYSTPSVTYVAGLRDAVWPAAPLVIGALQDTAILPPNATGLTYRPRLDKAIGLMRALLPDMRKVVLAGDRMGRHNEWSQAAQDLAALAPPAEIVDLTGLPISDIEQRLARLPNDAAVYYLGITTDPSGERFVPAEMARLVATNANRPTFVGVETFFAAGGSVGGLLTQPHLLSEQLARLALRILAGEQAADIPLKPADIRQPVFDWRQLQRWGIPESRLPPDSAIRFRNPTLWEQSPELVLATIGAFLLLLTVIALLAGYLLQSRRRSRAEEALTDSESQMALATAATRSGLWRINLHDETVALTDMSLELFGLACGRAYDLMDLSKAVHPEDRQLFLRTMFSAVRLNAPIDLRFRVAAPAGGVRWIAAKANASQQDGAHRHTVDGLFYDVTLIKELENERDQQRQEVTYLMRQSVVNELSGSLAHELNQPLTAIMANAEAALDQLDRSQADLTMVRESLQDIVEADVRAAEVINRVRRLIRKDGGRRELIDVERLVESTQVLLRSEFVRRRVSLKVEIDAHLPPLPGDFVQLQQVLINILMNAMEAIAPAAPPPREVTLAVVHERGRAVFVVTDTGPGIAADIEGKLFEPLATTKSQGLGLGLSICATIAKQHGGGITLANNPGGGAIATLTLPLQLHAEAAQ